MSKVPPTWEDLKNLEPGMPVTGFVGTVKEVYDGKTGEGKAGPWGFVRLWVVDTADQAMGVTVWSRGEFATASAADYAHLKGKDVVLTAVNRGKGWFGVKTKWNNKTGEFDGLDVSGIDMVQLEPDLEEFPTTSRPRPAEARSPQTQPTGRPSGDRRSGGQGAAHGGKLTPDEWVAVATRAGNLLMAGLKEIDPSAIAALVSTLMISIGRGETEVPTIPAPPPEREPGEDEEPLPF